MTDHAGTPWATLRTELKLSRDKFAEQTGLTPGAIWRIEAKGKFKPGELDQLLAFSATKSGLPPLPPTPTSPVIIPVEPPPQPAPPISNTAVVPLNITHLEDELSDSPLTWLPAKHDALTVVEQRLDPLGSEMPGEPPIDNEMEQTPYERFLADGIRRYSNSEIQTFKRCRRKWFLAHYRQLTPKYTSPVGARAIGDRLHRALRWHYHGNPALRLDVRDALEAIIQIDRHVLLQYYAPELVPLGLDTKFNQEADLERVMIAGYIEWLSETGADSEFQVIGSEQYVETLFNGLGLKQPVMLVARLDARVRRIGDGARLFIDHKSVGGFEQPMRTLSINEQMLWYLMLEHMLTKSSGSSERVDGAIYNMLRRSKRTERAKPPFYHRVEVRHNVHELNNFAEKTAGVIAEIERTRARLDTVAGLNHRHVAYPTPSQDCTWSCDFLPLENLIDDGSDWEGMAKAFFDQGDPSAYYRKTNDITIS